MTAPVLELSGVSVRLGGRLVLHDVSLGIAEGEIVALLGPSGSGKSTLVRILLGLTLPDVGTVRIAGNVASAGRSLRIPPEARDIAVVFQDLALWPHMSVKEHLRFVLGSRQRADDRDGDLIADTLSHVGLSGLERRFPAQLSGGEQQRLAVARALVLEPTAIVLDEPLANLDIVKKEELLELFSELFSRHRSTVLHVTHDPDEAAALASRFAIVEGGRIVHDDLPERLTGSGSVFAEAVAARLRRW